MKTLLCCDNKLLTVLIKIIRANKCFESLSPIKNSPLLPRITSLNTVIMKGNEGTVGSGWSIVTAVQRGKF